MAKKSTAEILISIKDKGKEKIKGMTQAFSTMKTGAIAAGVAITAVGAGIGKLALDAGKFEEVERAFENLAISQGKNADDMLAILRDATAGTVSQMELMQQANSAMLLGLPIDKLGDMARIAKGAAVATGQSMDFMLNSIVTGLGRQSKLILDNLGIIISAEDANDKYAKSLDRTAASLTDAEKKTAFINEAMATGIKNLENLGEEQDSTTMKWQRFKTVLSDLSIELGTIFKPAMDTMLDVFNELGDTVREYAANDGFKNFSRSVVLFLVDMEAEIDRFVDDLTLLGRTMAVIAKAAFLVMKGEFGAASKAYEDWEKEKVVIAEQQEKERSKKKAAVIERFRQEDIAEEERQNEEKEKMAKRTEFKKKLQAIREAKDKEDKIGTNKVQKTKETEAEVTKVKITEAQKFFEEQGKLEDAEAEEREKLLVQEAADSKEMWEGVSSHVTAFTSSGLQGLASGIASMVGDSFLPGIGGAVGAIFDLLSKDTEEFKGILDELLSVDFIRNIAANINQFILGLIDNAPEIIGTLIEQMIIGAPKIAVALTKLLLSPEFYVQIAAAIVEGFMSAFWQIREDVLAELSIIKNILQPDVDNVNDFVNNLFGSDAPPGQEPTKPELLEAFNAGLSTQASVNFINQILTSQGVAEEDLITLTPEQIATYDTNNGFTNDIPEIHITIASPVLLTDTEQVKGLVEILAPAMDAELWEFFQGYSSLIER